MSLKLMRWLHQRGLSRKRLKGGILHNWFGDHLFNPHLWRLEREGVALAMLLGCLCALSPFFGLHLLIGCSLAMIFRANIPLTAALQFITNPFTVIFYYPSAYLLGARILGEPAMRVENFREILRSQNLGAIWQVVSDIFWPLFLGCMVCGIAVGTLCWALVLLLWPTHRKHPPDRKPTPSDSRPQRNDSDRPQT